MKCLFAGATDTGCVRSANQDSYYIDPDGRFFVVADGMGGHAGGEIASKIAVDSIRACLESFWDAEIDPQKLMQDAIDKANQAIINDQMANPVRSDMGTTVVLLLFRDERPWFCHIGDSRLYRLRGTKLEQISDDHTWIARAIQTGIVNAHDAKIHPWRHMLLQCLGREDLKSITAREIEWQPGDRFLICSDGLTEEVTDARITHHLKSILNCQQAAEALIDSAKKHGGRDNITVVIVSNELNPNS
ncbi:MAG: PP2C family protein-serine/threonine phosphatase [Pseudanabaena sp.]|jgi:serine/threonine protein phosphatase PrpC|nr:serine/threonine-protein phosphatase [Pseudanabaena sp. M53BS1SP1A06MG]MCA6583593.1 serine/threonine-protein phosphatase [Pseudanabaena sp. M34BS1SP1A06MG]MCA6586838.1 serine/threonine-protein phosphatase [Pseudanabaena sp. M051S1SP1A06QC]MCA6590084.1 serine/threonine-protein phosphatase [Pseudanabaena sp. M109S1SP1A06QC]MCA6590716.1 serine/threonine-protein phosphatase [Pseudanabaena sp. M38BS1SP1A06MG]MCA6595548.1 serine/threonine-protein phosphatase [Pseudanabaena sp. M046S1SP1A06QC]MCA